MCLIGKNVTLYFIVLNVTPKISYVTHIENKTNDAFY